MLRRANSRPSRRPGGSRDRRRAVLPRSPDTPSLAPTAGRGRWVQVNLALFPQGGGLPAYFPWRDLWAALQRWRRVRGLRCCFFMRKAPGLRLRGWCGSSAQRFERELVGWLQAAERRNDIRNFRLAVYEPERFHFGGPIGMAIAHDAFDRHCQRVLQYESLGDSDQRTLPRELFWLATLSELIALSAETSRERREVWRRLASWAGVTARTSAEGALGEQARAALERTPSFWQSLSLGAAAVLAQAGSDNAHIAARLRRAAAAGALTVSCPRWLVTTGVFCCNQVGAPLETSAVALEYVLQLLDEPGRER
jgi:thiopeptide-type bacteriocin biosynthesis protein